MKVSAVSTVLPTVRVRVTAMDAGVQRVDASVDPDSVAMPRSVRQA